MWRRKLSFESLEDRRVLSADFSGNGTVGAEDLDIWKTGFGTVTLNHSLIDDDINVGSLIVGRLGQILFER